MWWELGAAQGRSGGGLGRANAFSFSLSLALWPWPVQDAHPGPQGPGGWREQAWPPPCQMPAPEADDQGHWGSHTQLCSQERHHSVLQPGVVLGAQSRTGSQGRWAVGAVPPHPDPMRAFPKDIPQANARQALSLGWGGPDSWAGAGPSPALEWGAGTRSPKSDF